MASISEALLKVTEPEANAIAGIAAERAARN